MFYEKIDLYREFGLDRKGHEGGYLTAYAPAPNPENKIRPRPAMLVCPGGGYSFLSHREGEPVCLRFLAEGFAAFLLSYTLKAAYPTPLVEAAMAAAYIRKHAERYGADREKLGVIGFSAGGHLAGMLSVLVGDPHVESALKEDAPLARPDVGLLCYPVVTTDLSHTHCGTANVISGGDGALSLTLSLEKRVTERSVPVFLWHTAADDCVPVENALLLASAYRKAGVPFEAHIFERGVHGLALADGETSDGEGTPLYEKNAQAWFPLALAWLKLRGFSLR